MALSKLAIGLIAAGVSVVTVSGTIAGVVVSRQNSSQVISSNKEEETSKPNSPSNPQNRNPERANDDPNTAIVTLEEELEEASKLINQQNIVIKINQDEKSLSEFYAFNISPESLVISKKANLDQSINVSFKLIDNKNSIAELNKGNLSISVTLTKQEKTKTVELTLTKFKKIDSKLENLFDRKTGSEPEAVDETYSLTITNKEEKKNEFITLEQLNKETNGKYEGWNEWLVNSTTPNNEKKAFAIEGKVKVTKLEKVDNKTYFTLKSVDSNKFLKLIKNEGSTKLEALVGSIKITNLLATDVSLIIDEKLSKNNTNYLSTLKATGETDKKYLETNRDSALNRTISVKIPASSSSSEPSSQVFIKPYLTEISAQDDSNQSIPLSISISFGKDNYLTTFKTSDNNTANMLKEAGINFNVYSKKLSETKKALEAEKITTADNKLETYFKDENYKVAITSTSFSDKSSNGMFERSELKTNLNDGFKLMVKKSELPQNWILFADYSYLGMEMNKVLFTPSISLIHIETAKQVGDS